MNATCALAALILALASAGAAVASDEPSFGGLANTASSLPPSEFSALRRHEAARQLRELCLALEAFVARRLTAPLEQPLQHHSPSNGVIGIFPLYVENPIAPPNRWRLDPALASILSAAGTALRALLPLVEAQGGPTLAEALADLGNVSLVDLGEPSEGRLEAARTELGTRARRVTSASSALRAWLTSHMDLDDAEGLEAFHGATEERLLGSVVCERLHLRALQAPGGLTSNVWYTRYELLSSRLAEGTLDPSSPAAVEAALAPTGLTAAEFGELVACLQGRWSSELLLVRGEVETRRARPPDEPSLIRRAARSAAQALSEGGLEPTYDAIMDHLEGMAGDLSGGTLHRLAVLPEDPGVGARGALERLTRRTTGD